MSAYSNFLHRLNAYREKLNLTQEEMAKMFGVHQSHYGRYEAGGRIITFKSLKLFEENGGDLFQLLTGCERVKGPMGDYLVKCATSEGKEKILNLLVWCVDFGCWMEKHPEDEPVSAMRKCMHLLELKSGNYTIWEGIRKVEDMTQIEMAKLLDIEVKRYRRIEKEEMEPDVEILCTLYDKLQYSPQMFFDVEKFYVDELNFYWNMLSDDTKAFLEKIVNAAVERVNRGAEKE